ncbi:MAG: phosphotransferase family protein [Nakamurella sp.]
MVGSPMFFDASIDADAAARFLSDHLGHPVGSVQEVGAGAWSNCFGYTDGGIEYVVRFGNYVDDYRKDQRASAFSSPRLPIPVVTDVGVAFGGYFAISTRAHGEPLELLGAADWAATVPKLLTVLDEIRAVPVAPDAGFGGWGANGSAPFASWRDFLLAVCADDPERRTYGWTTKLADSPYGDEAFRAGYGRLAELSVAIPSPQFLVHSDLINRNVLVRNRHITAVFDWGCSLYGDFLYDIAWIEFWAPWYPAMNGVDFLATARAHLKDRGVAIEDFDARARCCLLHIGLDHLAYNAFTGNMVDLGNTIDRLALFV